MLSVVEPRHGVAAIDQPPSVARSSFDEVVGRCQIMERDGKTRLVIGDVEGGNNADLIIMGTRGITLESDLQRTAARVIQLAPWPVLVVL